MTIVFDLDYTLLDAGRLKEDLGTCLEECGISSEKFWEAYSESAEQGPRVRDFDPKKQLAHLEASLTCGLKDAEERIVTIAENAKHYVIRGAEPLLASLKKDGHRLILWTHGNEEWQRMKIGKSGLGGYFDEIIITTGKKEEDERLAGLEGPLVGVNDSGVEIEAMKRERPDMTMISVPGPKGSPAPHIAHIASSLEDVYRIIKTL